jgi:hypothetical protein
MPLELEKFLRKSTLKVGLFFYFCEEVKEVTLRFPFGQSKKKSQKCCAILG